jgi:hypothetical protein
LIIGVTGIEVDLFDIQKVNFIGMLLFTCTEISDITHSVEVNIDFTPTFQLCDFVLMIWKDIWK